MALLSKAELVAEASGRASEQTSLSVAAQQQLLQTLAQAGPSSSDTAAEQAFTALYSFYAPRLKSFLRKQGAGERADDLTQDTMIKVWQQAARYDATKASVSTWIYTIARNVWVDALRREDYPDVEALLQQVEPASTPEAALSRAETIRAVQAALGNLPPTQQQVLARTFYHDETQAMIAARTGQPLGTVKSRLRLAFAALRTKLGREKV